MAQQPELSPGAPAVGGYERELFGEALADVEHYPGVNQDLLRECRILVLAMITTWRWDRGDQLPNGRQRAQSG